MSTVLSGHKGADDPTSSLDSYPDVNATADVSVFSKWRSCRSLLLVGSADRRDLFADMDDVGSTFAVSDWVVSGDDL